MGSLKMFDSSQICYQEWGNENSKKVLSLHGWLDNSNTFTHLGPPLASIGYHVIAIDFVGHGRSSHLHSTGSYSMVKSASYVAYVIEQLGWNKCSVIGHSMGAAISMIYASAYPEKIEKLVLIEGFGPMTLPGAATVKNLRKAIDSEHKAAAKAATSSSAKTYNTLEDAISARVSSVSMYPGNQTISRDAAKLLVARGVSVVSYDGAVANIENDTDITDDTVGPVRFRHDPRLVLPTFQYHTEEQVMCYVNNIQAKTLLVSGENGWSLNEEFEKRKSVLVDKNLLTHAILPGSHHLHLDTDTAPLTVDTICEYLLEQQ